MSSNPQQTLETISSLVEPVVQASGHHLYDVQHNGGTLTVLVESQKALGVDELSELSRVLSNALDDDDPIPGRYTLEVSTPGVERRLRRAGHFAGAIGETVNIRTTPGTNGRRRIVGNLISVDGEFITIDESNRETVTIHIDEIEKARTVFEWGGGPKPGSRSRKRESKFNHEGGSQ